MFLGGFLFDLDGVLLDSQELHWLSWQQACLQYPAFKMSYAEFLASFGQRNHSIISTLMPHADEALIQKISSAKETWYRSHGKEGFKLYPGAIEFLQALEKKKIPKAIASSTPQENLLEILRSTPLGHHFSHFVSAESVQRGKPYPDVFIAAAQSLQLDPGHCIAIEDAPDGLKAAKTAGCFTIALTTTHPKTALHHYDLIFESIAKINLESLLHKF